MNDKSEGISGYSITFLLVICLCVLAGCATDSYSLKNQVGTMTYSQALSQFGAPDSTRVKKSGEKVHTWMAVSEFGAMHRHVMTFSPEGVLSKASTQYMGEVAAPLGPVFDDEHGEF